MQRILFTSVLIATASSAFAQHGELKLVSDRAGETKFVCRLTNSGGNVVEIPATIDRDRGVMSVSYFDNIAPVHGTYTYKGPYVEGTFEPKDGGAKQTVYALAAGPYHAELTYTEGAAQPKLTMAWGAEPLLCE